MRKLITPVGLVLALVLTVTPALAADPNPGKGNTDVVVMNMGSTPTDASAVYFNASGVAEYSASTLLAAKGSYRFSADAAGPLGDNWSGSMVIQSPGELAAVAELLWVNGSSYDGTTADAYTGFPDGATIMYVPYAVYSVNSQFTRFSVQNTGATPAEIVLTFRNRNGVEDLQVPDTIPAQGAKPYDMRDFPQLRNSSFWLNNCSTGQCQWTGAVKIEATNGGKIAAAATNHWTDYAAAYNGVATGTTPNFVSSVERRCTNCSFNPAAGQWGVWQGFSIVSVQCLAAVPCEVQIRFIGQTSTMGNLTLPTRTVASGAAVGANTRAGGDYNRSLFNALRNSSDPSNQAAWAGSVIVNTLNNTEVAVVAYNQRPDVRISTGNSGAGSADAGTQVYVPSVYKIGTCDGGSNWRKFSIIRIQNPTAQNANQVNIYYYNRDGSLAFQELNFNIPAGTALSRNTRNNCTALTQLGNNWEGSVHITADQPVVAVAETYNNAFNVPAFGASWAAGYNAYSVSP